MDSAPIPPPCDDEFAKTFVPALQESPAPYLLDDDDEPATPNSPLVTSVNGTLRQPSLSRLLEMQRVLYETILDPRTEVKDKAGLARAWKELEILRHAKRGKPLALNASVRLDVPRTEKSTPILSLMDSPDDSVGNKSSAS
jgi:hypothetical protein